MTQAYKYTLASALEADKNEELFQWAQDYLRGEGWNSGLADHLIEEKPSITKLIEFPLNKLKRIMGPEQGMNFVEASDVWEKRVSNLVEIIKGGKEIPPLIVTDFWKPFELSDGSHRHEALIRSGYDKYWTIFFFKDSLSLQLLSLD